LIERAFVVCLTAQNYSEHEMRGRKAGIQLDRAAKLGGSFIQVAQLSFDYAKFEMDVSRGLRLKRPFQFELGIVRIALLRKDTSQQAMSSGMGWIERFGDAELADCLRLILQVVPGCAQSVMRLGPFRPELYCGLKFFQGLAVFSLVLQCQCEVVVRDRVSR
jgi:hypothetical protein